MDVCASVCEIDFSSVLVFFFCILCVNILYVVILLSKRFRIFVLTNSKHRDTYRHIQANTRTHSNRRQKWQLLNIMWIRVIQHIYLFVIYDGKQHTAIYNCKKIYRHCEIKITEIRHQWFPPEQSPRPVHVLNDWRYVHVYDDLSSGESWAMMTWMIQQRCDDEDRRRRQTMTISATSPSQHG